MVGRGLDADGATAEPEAVSALVGLADGDARAVLTTLEVAVALAGSAPVTLDDVERARHSRLHHYGEDDHYDQVSAFIKSVRGSDPDAGLYWLARMLEAGEDARFIARRLVILASEDIGEADPAGPGGGRRRRPGRGVRGAARGPAQPGPGRGPPGLRPQVQPGHRGPRSGPARRAGGPAGNGPGPSRATPTTGARGRSATGRATSIPTTSPRPGPISSTGPTSCRTTATTSRATAATRRWWPNAWPGGAVTDRPGGLPRPATTEARQSRPDCRP